MGLVAMTEAGAPELTVWYDGSSHTFGAAEDVVVGRDIRADLRVPEPLISRAHLVLRVDGGRWVAIDNDSLNGMYVQGRRVATVDLEDGLNINVGSLVGPLLTFEVGRTQPADHPPAAPRSTGRAPPRSPRRDRPPSAAPPTTTSWSPTCWPRAATRCWCPPRRAPKSTTRTAAPAPSSTAPRSIRRCCTTATWSPSATLIWCLPAARWCAAARPKPPP